jgi:hypothetical protein
MDGNNHYIRINTDNIVIYAFSDAFEQPLETDILVESSAGRHYNPVITDGQGNYVYKWDGTQMVDRTQDSDYLLAKTKSEKLAEIQTMLNSAVKAFISSALGSVHTYVLPDTLDMTLIESEDRYMQSADYDGNPVTWYTVEAGYVDHSKDEFHQVYLDGRASVQRKRYRAKDLMTQVNTTFAANDLTTLQSIDVAGADWS